jgi:transposase
MVELRSGRWRCRNRSCNRRIFTERLPGTVQPFAQRTRRVVETLHLVGHNAGGRPGERLMARFGMPLSDDTILRHLKAGAKTDIPGAAVRVVGIDDWAWRKGQSYGTIFVDLETRTVTDVLPDRSASSAAEWLTAHPGIEIVCRDRCGLYAEAARCGAPKARQVADRFHLLQNLREAIEKQLSNIGRPIRATARDNLATPGISNGQREVKDQQQIARTARRAAQLSMFAQLRAMFAAGRTAADIVRNLGLSRKRVDKWVRLQALPERAPMAPKPCSPAFYQNHLARRWAEGCTHGRQLFAELKDLGYSGCFSYLARFLSPWRRKASKSSTRGSVAIPRPCHTVIGQAGRVISPLVAAALCMKPRPLLTPPQAKNVDLLKKGSGDFVAMRRLAMRFRGILCGGSSVEKLEQWIIAARQSGIDAMQHFARRLLQDIDAVRNAVTERWSNGQTEGQISRLKTVKRSMYNRAGVELLRARMLPLSAIHLHQG